MMRIHRITGRLKNGAPDHEYSWLFSRGIYNRRSAGHRIGDSKRSMKKKKLQVAKLENKSKFERE